MLLGGTQTCTFRRLDADQVRCKVSLAPGSVRMLQGFQGIAAVDAWLIHQNKRQGFARVVDVIRRTDPPHR